MNTVVGLVAVFAVLIFLILVIMAFGKMGGNKNQEPVKEKKAAPAPVPAAPAAAVVQPQDDIELQIVLGMAIAMYEQETGAAGGDGYVVRSIRKNRKNNWKRA